MILFRRIGLAFRGIEGREWALLSLETIGVVAGILIAFELNEWAGRRSEAARHERLMERLFEESEVAVGSLRNLRDILEGFVEDEEKFAADLSKGRCPAAGSWEAVTTVELYPSVGVPTSVYQELTTAGGLSSVEQQSVRLALTQFHGQLDWTQRQLNYFRDARIKVLEPSDARVRVSFDEKADDPEVWTFDRAAVCRDQAFRNRFAAATRGHLIYSEYVRDLTKDAIVMCGALGASLGRSCEARAGGPFSATGGQLTGDDALVARNAAKM